MTDVDPLENFLSEAMVSNAKNIKPAQDSKAVSADRWRTVVVLQKRYVNRSWVADNVYPDTYGPWRV